MTWLEALKKSIITLLITTAVVVAFVALVAGGIWLSLNHPHLAVVAGLVAVVFIFTLVHKAFGV